jgi:hypothetical protein
MRLKKRVEKQLPDLSEISLSPFPAINVTIVESFEIQYPAEQLIGSGINR